LIQQKVTKRCSRIAQNTTARRTSKCFKKGLKLSQDFQKQLDNLEREFSSNLIKCVIGNLKEKYSSANIHDYLSQVENNIEENIQVFKGVKPEGQTTPEGFVIDYFKEYEVNIILDNTDTVGCVIIETSPILIFSVILKKQPMEEADIILTSQK
jgi:hypothetical protein